MIKKLGLIISLMLCSAISAGVEQRNNLPDDAFPPDVDPFNHVLGYTATQKDEGFPPSISEITRNFGQRDSLEVAIPTGTGIIMTDKVEHIIKSNVVNKAVIYTIKTKDINIIEFNNNKFNVKYTVGSGYFYGAEVLLKFDQKFSTDEQTAFLNDKVRRYLEYNGFSEVPKLLGLVKNNIYKKDDLTVVVRTENNTNNGGVLITIFNEEINKEMAAQYNKDISEEIKTNFKDVDHFLK